MIIGLSLFGYLSIYAWAWTIGTSHICWSCNQNEQSSILSTKIIIIEQSSILSKKIIEQSSKVKYLYAHLIKKLYMEKAAYVKQNLLRPKQFHSVYIEKPTWNFQRQPWNLNFSKCVIFGVLCCICACYFSCISWGIFRNHFPIHILFLIIAF